MVFAGALLFFIIFVAVIAMFVVGCVMKKTILLRISGTILCVIGFLLFLILMLMLMPMFGMYMQWITYLLCGGLFVVCLLLIWGPFTKKLRLNLVKLFIGIAIVPLICVGCYQAYQNSFLKIGEGDNELPLYNYQPFIDNTWAQSLDEDSTLKFTSDLPRLDGATALYPLYSAFARATYPEAEYRVYNIPVGLQEYPKKIEDVSSNVICSRTGGSFEHLMGGHVDVIFLMGISDDQRAMADELGLKLKLTPIGKEAFVFFVNQRNAAADISIEEIKGIYSGKITSWREISGKADNIRAYQRPENSGSQTMLQEIMGDVPLATPLEEDVYGSMMGMYKVVSAYRNYKNSIGYSFRYYIKDMLNDDEVKLLSIDGVAPNEATISSGAYPYASDFYAVTVEREPLSEEDARRMENTELLIDWILSEQGQYLVEATGYVPYSN